MKTIKRVGSVIKHQCFKPKHKEKYILDLIKMNKGNGYIRKGNFSSEVVWDSKSFVFPTSAKQKSYNKGMFLFGMVRKDAKSFIKSGKTIKVPNKYPTNEYNDNFDKFDEKITGTDLNHAYWRIALNLGIISKNTYFKGLDDEFKSVRLAALSTLGKGRDYFVIRDGLITEEVVKIGVDDEMDALYRAIRYNCFKYMQIIKAMLKNDFVCYRTDCVYYVDSAENRKIVRDYFKEQNMTMKQLYSIKKPYTSKVSL
jgi:hypothetical protein